VNGPIADDGDEQPFHIKKTSGLTKGESEALKHARSTMAAAVQAFAPLRTQASMTQSQVRSIAADAVKEMPATMARKVEAGLLDIAKDMRENGYYDEQQLRDVAFSAATTAPDEWVTPGSGKDDEDRAVEEIVANIPRAT
jgi:hypothetical protein